MFFWLMLLTHVPLVELGSSQVAKFSTLPMSPVTKLPLRPVPIWTFLPNCWTVWFDRDDPVGSGDWETLLQLRKEHPGKICDKPLQIQVQTTGGAPAASTGDIFFKFDAVTGFVCRNADQNPFCKCHDYKVRFLCPFKFCYSLFPHYPLISNITVPITMVPPYSTDFHTNDLSVEWSLTHDETTPPPPTTTPSTTITTPGGPFSEFYYTKDFFPITKTLATKTFATKPSTVEFITKPKTKPTLYTRPPPVTDFIEITDRQFATVEFITKPKTKPTLYTRPPPGTDFIEITDHQFATVEFITKPKTKPTLYTRPPPFTDIIKITDRQLPITETLATKTFATEKFATKPSTVEFITKPKTKPTWYTRPPFTDIIKITDRQVPITETLATVESITTPKTKPTLPTLPPFTKPMEISCWTPWFDRDDPSGSGDWETLLSLRLQNPGKICSTPLQIQVQTTSGLPLSSTGDVISKCDTVTGFICKNADQTKKRRCSDYKVRFRCPPEFCAPPPVCWTEWFDRDDPSGSGDWETLQQLRFEYPGRICYKPLQIQVQTTAGLPLGTTGDVIHKADTVTGFICRNWDQKKGRCQDYKVRFRCPLRFCVQSNCWTQWFDRDDPSGSGDWETLPALHISYPEQICDAPLQIQAQTTTGLPASATGNVFTAFDTTAGLICKNSEQRWGIRCHDFQVRFLCPPEFCRPKGCYTDWFDRDDPSGSGDWETLFALRAEFPGLICPKPLQIQVQTINGYSVAATGNIITAADVTTGFICQNSAQPSGLCHDFKVRFVCPLDFCQQKVCWTDWFNRDNPAGTGDWELLSFLKKLHPNKICDTPLYIDVRTVDTNQPITVTGQTAHIYSPTEGFACRNKDQTGRGCRDYKVRFGCPCKCIVDTDSTESTHQSQHV